MNKRFYAFLTIPLIIISIFLVFFYTQFLLKNQNSKIENPSQNDINNVKEEKELTLNLVGDIFLDRGIEKVVKKRGHKFLFKNIKSQLSDADITFANLEGPASFLGMPYKNKPPGITFRADPSMLFQLLEGGIDVVSLANNHINDHYEKALLETTQFLDLINIKYFGAGENIYEARRPAVLDVKGYKLAFLGYSEDIWSVVQATYKSSGTVHINMETIINDIKYTRELYDPDFILVSVHWGLEYVTRPRKSDQKLAHQIINSGADVLIGHHPHVLQGIEIYKNKVIFYSLGNFVFDMYDEIKRESMIIKLIFKDDKIDSIEILPVIINKSLYYPSVATDDEGKKILEHIEEYSKAFRTKMKYSEKQDKILISLKSIDIKNTTAKINK